MPVLLGGVCSRMRWIDMSDYLAGSAAQFDNEEPLTVCDGGIPPECCQVDGESEGEG